MISVDLTSNTSTIQKVKSAVLNALISFLPDEKLEASQQESSKRIQPMQRSLKFNTLTGSCCNLQLNSDDNTPNISSKDNQSISTAASSPSTSPVRMKSHMSSTELRNIDRMRMPNSNSSKKEFTDFSDSSPDNHQCDVHHHSSTVVSKSNHIDCSCSVQPSSLMINSPSSLQSGQQQQSVYTTSNNSPFITLNVNTIQSSASTPNAASSPSDGFSLRESYVYKQFRKFSQDDDCWSLLSLGMPSSDSKVIEFKFVDRMKRQFEFTVDSFQIILDPLLSFYECNPAKGINPHFYPTVVGESVAGSFSEALYHLENKLIATIEPEMIRGGGLLKYCRLLVSGYKPVEGVDVHTLEKYMSSRFFIDFQDITSQKVKLEAFLANHFSEHEISVKINYLRILYQVVSGSTICLMSHEHFQTLNLITEMLRYLMHYYHYCYSQFNRSSLSLEWFTEKQNLVLDKIYFGTQLFPVISRSEPYSSSHCYCRLANKPTPVIQSHSKIEQKSSCTFYNGKKNNLQTVSSASPSSTDTTKLKSDAVIQSDEQNNK
ncbi:unnamed protein product [Trichobilharzia regenti]|nr:unnamed protein product [Trichobilharzia regenti]